MITITDPPLSVPLPVCIVIQVTKKETEDTNAVLSLPFFFFFFLVQNNLETILLNLEIVSQNVDCSLDTFILTFSTQIFKEAPSP